ncbi:thioredoxin family protein [Kitasatospora atroaurantiaca]|uniref:AhpC/TSA family protein n=1 Tax=Kitasatospora atroaurantiaca TaxID=285545 RepID=A0A561F156_9ACTN|nr:thioredoxin family protein [Kitasatospora atroaurantiaca]TWE21598.1 AhpC/TSA family protein [Kitasatospora atroaurantiaca]
MAASSTMVPLGTPAADFSLPALDGRTVARDDFAAAPALLVAFLCNHCPYVRHVEHAFGELVNEFPDLAVVGICSNSPEIVPSDGPDGLRAQVARTGWAFPYLIDGDQSVGRAYRAACTPDFFLFNSERELAYRGAMDESTPGNRKPVTGNLLRGAIASVLAGKPVPEPHRASMGCSIKWATGHD